LQVVNTAAESALGDHTLPNGTSFPNSSRPRECG
jgi:hypothetical protein